MLRPVSTFIMVVIATLLGSAGATAAQQTASPAAAAPGEAPDYIEWH
jgi:hypothetical protein